MLSSFKQELAEQGSVQFSVRILPNAPMSIATERLSDDSVKIKIASPAENNKANIELIRFLAKQFGVHKSAVAIVSGITSRQKIIRITT